jgi:hypothetical protein
MFAKASATALSVGLRWQGLISTPQNQKPKMSTNFPKTGLTIHLGAQCSIVELWANGGRGGIRTEEESFSETHYSATTTLPPEAYTLITNERQ